MPTPSKTSAGGILAAARELIAEQGLDVLTMQSIATRVGVRGPSLYKYFPDRTALLNAVELSVIEDLEQAIQGALTDANLSDKDALRAIAAAYRQYAQSAPSAYRLLFQLQADDPETEAARRRALAPALTRLVSLLDDSQEAFLRARVLTSFLHGFCSMESAGSFRMGGSVDEAFHAGIELLLKKPKK